LETKSCFGYECVSLSVTIHLIFANKKEPSQWTWGKSPTQTCSRIAHSKGCKVNIHTYKWDTTTYTSETTLYLLIEAQGSQVNLFAKFAPFFFWRLAGGV
jgi:hypothetical protein